MGTTYLALAITATLALTSCTRRDTAHRDEPAARQVGRDAYTATQDLKRGAKKAEQDLRNAGKELREGWNEAKHDTPPPPPPPPPARRDRDR